MGKIAIKVEGVGMKFNLSSNKVDNLKVINSEGDVIEESPEYKKRWDDFKDFTDWTEKRIIGKL